MYDPYFACETGFQIIFLNIFSGILFRNTWQRIKIYSYILFQDNVYIFEHR